MSASECFRTNESDSHGDEAIQLLAELRDGACMKPTKGSECNKQEGGHRRKVRCALVVVCPSQVMTVVVVKHENSTATGCFARGHAGAKLGGQALSIY